MKQLLLALFLCLGFFASAQTVTIPDPNFKAALLDHDPVIDTNGDGEIQVSEAEGFSESMNVSEKNINDLTGIASFINITHLFCDDNNLTDLNVTQNTNLIQLNCRINPLLNLDVTQNAVLKILNCSFTDLSTVNVSQNIQLEELTIGGDEWETIDVTNNPNLKILFNYYSDISDLDVSQNFDLENLVMQMSELSELDLSNNTQLIYLTLSYNNFTEIDLTPLVNLERLGVYYNQFTELDLSQNTNLERLHFQNNSLSEIDVSQNVLLETIDGSNNLITNINLTQNENLEKLKLDYNLLTEIDLSNNANLCSIEAKNNPLLESINFKNGNNTILIPGSPCYLQTTSYFDVSNNSNLQYICVDDVGYALENFVDVPSFTTFTEDCSILGNSNTIAGTLRFDNENDGCDANDAGIEDLIIRTTDGTNDFATTSSESGVYNLNAGVNTYTTTVLGLSPYFSVTPNEIVDTFTGFNQSEIADFCIAPAFTANDLSISIIPTDVARPGFETTYTLTYENLGTTTLSGDITLEFDESRISFVSATPLETSQTGNTITWSYSNFHPFETKSIDVGFSVLPPPTNQSGDILNFTATGNPVNIDETPDDNVFELNQEVVNSFDPNDKQVVQGSQVLIEKADEYLHYIVRFQNTGTASAVNVRVQDNLDELLDWTTLKILDASHEMNVGIIDGKVDFIFNNIDLPTEDIDPEGSQGYVAYKIKPLSGIAIGDVIENTASIYFDFNPAIITNTVSTTYVEELGVGEFKGSNIVLYPNPADNNFTIEAVSKINSIEILNVLGQTIITKSGASNKEQISVSGLQTGNYFVKVTTEDGSETMRVLKK